MNIQNEIKKIFPSPSVTVIDYLGDESNGVEGRLYVAEAHARFFEHLKLCAATGIARHKNIGRNSEIMAAIMANDVQGLAS